jgi:hypothetical protein
MVENTGLENLCYIAKSPTEFQFNITELWEKEFNEWDMENRNVFLTRDFDNISSAERLMTLFP